VNASLGDSSRRKPTIGARRSDRPANLRPHILTSGGQHHLWWTASPLVDSITSGGQHHLWWAASPLVDSITSGGQHHLWWAASPLVGSDHSPDQCAGSSATVFPASAPLAHRDITCDHERTRISTAPPPGSWLEPMIRGVLQDQRHPALTHPTRVPAGPGHLCILHSGRSLHQIPGVVHRDAATVHSDRGLAGRPTPPP
jgi:hypothetical protein